MHILAVDVGNTRTKWGLWDGLWLRQDSVPTAELALLGGAWRALPTPRQLIACSVAGRQGSDWLEAWALSQGLSPWGDGQRERRAQRLP
jgi:pantothenate kinase type III